MGHITMGQEQKKYHITAEGDVYKINEDGSFTSLGNAEQNYVYTDTKLLSGERYNVILESAGNQKLLVVKTIKELTSCPLKYAKSILDNIPSVIIDNISEAQATHIKSDLERIGAVVSIELYATKYTNHSVIGNDASKSRHSTSGKGSGCLCILFILVFTSVSLITYLI